MIQSSPVIKELLLNFFLILSPIYFYHFVVNKLTVKKNKIYLGFICGIASILCMTFPIMSGQGFLWDLRWIAFIMAILYGGKISGAIAGLMLVSYRFSLGGLPGSINVLVVACVLLLIFLTLESRFQKETKAKKLYAGILYALLTFVIVITAIWTHFWLSGKLEFFYREGSLVFLLMGCSYVVSSVLFIFITETIISFTRLKEVIHEAEKLNMVSELSKLFSYDIKTTVESARDSIQRAQKAGQYGSSILMNQAIEELDKTDVIIEQYVNYTNDAGSNTQKFAIKSIVSEVTDLILPYANVKGVKLITEIDPGWQWEGERLKLKHALLNVVKNSVDATAKGGTVTIDVNVKKNLTTFTITDSGIGMSADQLDKIINFQMKSESRIIGHGLLVTFGFIETMGGTLTYESAVGKGTKAIIKIPTKQSAG